MQSEILAMTRALRDTTGNLEPVLELLPDRPAPIVRNTPEGPELALARWGMPGPPQFGGTPITNIRNIASPHWRRWLGPEHRCVVPWTRFCEYEDTKPKKTPRWFVVDEDERLAFFAGIWTTWHGVRGTKANPVEGEHSLFGFLMTEPNAEVRPIHPKAMPVILRTTDEVEAWLTLPTTEAMKMQLPLPDGTLKIVARGERADGLTGEPAPRLF